MRRFVATLTSVSAGRRARGPVRRSVSVVIPSYNHARYIGQAIRSVLEQEQAVDELIIVDDGSRDDSRDIIRETVAAYVGPVRIHVDLLGENVGAHRAIEAGLARARGDVLTILNSDDAFTPDRIKTVLEAAPATGDFIAFTGIDFIDDAGARLPDDDPTRAWYQDVVGQARAFPTVGYVLLRNNISVTSGNLVFSRSLHRKVGPFAAYRMCHDWDFVIRCLYHVEPIYIRTPHLHYRTHPTNTMKSSGDRMYAEGSSALKTYFDLIGQAPPPNGLAPSPQHWPVYFDFFTRTYASWFSGTAIREEMLALSAGSTEPRSTSSPESISSDAVAAFRTRPSSDQDALAFRRLLGLLSG